MAASCRRLERSASNLTESNSNMLHNYLASFLNNAVLWSRLDIMCVCVCGKDISIMSLFFVNP